MDIKENEILILENNERYIILNTIIYNDEKYYLSMGILDNNEIIPSKVVFIKSKILNDELYINKITDENILSNLIKQLKNNN